MRNGKTGTRFFIGLFIVLAATIVFAEMYKGWLGPALVAGFYALTSFFIGFVLAYLLRFIVNPLTGWICRIIKNIKPKAARGLAVFIAYFGLFVLVGGILWLLIPNLYNNIVRFAERVPDYYQLLQTELNGLLEKWGLSSAENTNALDGFLKRVYENIQNNLSMYAGELGKIVLGAAQLLFNVGIGILISIYLLMDAKRFKSLFTKVTGALIGSEKRESFYRFLHEADQTMGRYINSKILECLIVGVLSMVAFFIVGAEYSLMFAVIFAVTNIIPYFGPIIGAVPVLLLTLLDSPRSLIWVLVAILVVQALNGYIIAPKIQGNMLKVSPFWVLFGVIVGGGMFGVTGMLLGAPAMAILAGLLQKFLAWKKENAQTRYKGEA